MNEIVYKPIQDLGMASYLMMLGYKVSSRKDKAIIFEVNKNVMEDFEDKETRDLNKLYNNLYESYQENEIKNNYNNKI